MNRQTIADLLGDISTAASKINSTKYSVFTILNAHEGLAELSVRVTEGKKEIYSQYIQVDDTDQTASELRRLLQQLQAIGKGE